jgi:leucyl aminopeptidase
MNCSRSGVTYCGPVCPATGVVSVPMRVVLSDGDPLSTSAAALAVPVSADAAREPGFELVDAALDGQLTRLLASGDAASTPGTITVVQTEGRIAPLRVLLAGVGRAGVDEPAEALRTAAAAAVRHPSVSGGRLSWYSPHDTDPAAVVEGAVLGSYTRARWKSEPPRPAPTDFVLLGPTAGLADVAREAEVVARWTNSARELVDTPPNLLTPALLAARTQELLAGLPVGVEVIGADGLASAGLAGVLAVGSGSANVPCVIVLRYAPAADGGEGGEGGEGARLGLVGKGITYDSGGLFLKQQGELMRQKADMGGAAAVIAAVGALAELRSPLPLVAVVPAAENLIDGAAYRPGDVVRTAAGITVEVTNTDCEGRLLLADGLWLCRQEEQITHLIDVATLTGAARAALGDMWSGVLANDDGWRDAIVDSGERSGDLAWPLPMHPRYRRLLESEVADIRNSSGRSFGYAIIAATFLEQFADDRPWAHIDIHSTAYLDEARGCFPAGATGAGVRLLVETARGLVGRR